MIVAALGTRTYGQVVVVELTGALQHGTPIRGAEVVMVKQKHPKERAGGTPAAHMPRGWAYLLVAG